jgi:hypothetical protein
METDVADQAAPVPQARDKVQDTTPDNSHRENRAEPAATAACFSLKDLAALVPKRAREIVVMGATCRKPCGKGIKCVC